MNIKSTKAVAAGPRSPKRGVKVQVILDKSQRTEKYSDADFLLHEGVPTFIDAKHAIAHNKIIIIDSHTVLTGSFNFTKAAEENNAENLLVIDDAALAKKYTENWQSHLGHSEPYTDEKGAMPVYAARADQVKLS